LILTQVLVDDDIRLARRAQSNAEAADRLLRRIQPRVWQVVRMIRGSREEAEELCQICLVEILENLHKFRGEGSLESWAGQVSYRVSMQHVKRKRRREAREAPMPEETIGSGSNPENQASRADVWRRLMHEMARSPEERRISLLLHLGDGYTVEEVSAITGVSANTTKDRLRTAYAELRAVFSRNPYLTQDILEIIHD
jgi:RNA polymerase sigma factor (sigma-70 family)